MRTFLCTARAESCADGTPNFPCSVMSVAEQTLSTATKNARLRGVLVEPRTCEKPARVARGSL